MTLCVAVWPEFVIPDLGLVLGIHFIGFSSFILWIHVVISNTVQDFIFHSIPNILKGKGIRWSV